MVNKRIGRRSGQRKPKRQGQPALAAKAGPAPVAKRFKVLSLSQRVPLVWDGDVHVAKFLECLCAAHLSSWVHTPFQDRSGIMIVGPPGMLKTSLLKVLERNYAHVLELSDINQKGLVELRQHLTTGRYRTLVLTDLAKLYERNPFTASNAEGTLKAMVAEGFAAAGFEDGTVAKLLARAVLVSAMAERFRAQHSRSWEDGGFARRFLWPLVTLKDPMILERSVVEQKLISFGVVKYPPVPENGVIQDNSTLEERKQLEHLVKYQPGSHVTQMALLHKMLVVLKWHYEREGRDGDAAYATLAEFARSLGPNGASLVV